MKQLILLLMTLFSLTAAANETPSLTNPSLQSEAPSIESRMTDLAVIFTAYSEYSNVTLTVNGEEVAWGSEGEEGSIDCTYGAPRAEQDYYITVQACARSMMGEYACTDEMSVLIPAITGNVQVRQENDYLVIDHTFYASYVSITINDQEVPEYDGQSSSIVDFLPYGNNSAGDYCIKFTAYEPNFFYEYTIERHIDAYLPVPIVETSLTADSLTLKVNSDMNETFLLVDGQEVQLLADSRYSIGRQDNAATIAAKAGNTWEGAQFHDKIWSDEVAITVPARLYGDINGDETLDITDVTLLISHVLQGSGSGSNKNCDINRDGRVDVSDVSMVISHILNPL